MIQAHDYKGDCNKPDKSGCYCGLAIWFDSDVLKVLAASPYVNSTAKGIIVQDLPRPNTFRTMDLVPNIRRLILDETTKRPPTSAEILEALSFLQPLTGTIDKLAVKQLERDIKGLS
jgi:hypothetical protein